MNRPTNERNRRHLSTANPEAQAPLLALPLFISLASWGSNTFRATGESPRVGQQLVPAASLSINLPPTLSASAIAANHPLHGEHRH
jgi:hypothetical protein